MEVQGRPHFWYRKRSSLGILEKDMSACAERSSPFMHAPIMLGQKQGSDRSLARCNCGTSGAERSSPFMHAPIIGAKAMRQQSTAARQVDLEHAPCFRWTWHMLHASAEHAFAPVGRGVGGCAPASAQWGVEAPLQWLAVLSALELPGSTPPEAASAVAPSFAAAATAAAAAALGPASRPPAAPVVP
eukprot:1156235-Pelagomonas_calceolata.AAC.24